MTRLITIDLDSPDPREAINAFLWAMSNARRIGFAPKTEHVLMEHFARENIGILYYWSAGGVTSILQGKEEIEQASDEDFDDLLAVIELLSRQRKRRRVARIAAEQLAPGIVTEGGDADAAPVPEGLEPSPLGGAK